METPFLVLSNPPPFILSSDFSIEGTLSTFLHLQPTPLTLPSPALDQPAIPSNISVLLSAQTSFSLPPSELLYSFKIYCNFLKTSEFHDPSVGHLTCCSHKSLSLTANPEAGPVPYLFLSNLNRMSRIQDTERCIFQRQSLLKSKLYNIT